MKKARRLLSLVLVCVTLLGILSACGKSGNASANAGNAEVVSSTGSPTMDKILEEGVVRVGVGTGGAPMGFVDDQGNPAGYDVDWALKMGEALGVKVEFVTVNGETRIPALTSGRIDVMLCNTTGNVERAKTVDFTIPYVVTGLKLLTAANSKYTSLEEMNSPDVKIALNRGTTMEALIDNLCPQAEKVYVTTFSEQLLLVEQGKVDGTLEDATVIDYAAMNSDGKLAAQVQYTSDPLCFGVRKGDLEFVRWLDMFISWQITQGWQAETYRKWWGTDPEPLKTLW